MKERYEKFKPFIIEAHKAHESGIINYKANGDIQMNYKGEKIMITLDHQFDLTQATMFGLNERLTTNATSPILDQQNKTLRDLFNEEWEKYGLAIEESNGHQFNYGYYVFYKERKDLVRFCPPFWHHVVSVASNSMLITDPMGKFSWQQIQTIFTNTKIGVVGCSVGSSITHAIVMDMRPRCIKLADKSMYKMENINRVRLGYWDITRSNVEKINAMDLGLKNKAEVVASQLYAVDPFMDIYIYNDGLSLSNAKDFFEGDDIDIVVEEADDPKIKIFVREEARKRRIPVVMATDVGSAIQLDILRYDKDKNLSLTYGTSDEDLYHALRALEQNATSRDSFFEFVDLLIGKNYRHGELLRIIEERSEIPTATIIPQLGSTVAVAGGIVAEVIACIRLGHEHPKRVFFNKRTFNVEKFY